MALMLVLAACGSSADEDETAAATAAQDTTTATEAPKTTTTNAPTTSAPTTTAVIDADEEDSMVATPPTFDPDATPLTGQFMPLEKGTYRVDTVGTPFSFVVDQSLFVQPNGEAFFVVTDPGSRGPDDRDIVFMRLSNLSDPTQPNASLEDQGDGWPVDDFGGWLDNLIDDVVVTDRAATTLGGLDAIRADLELAEGATCGVDTPFCVGFGTNRLVNGKSLDPGSRYRIWVVDQDGEAPLAVIVAIDAESKADWFDTADEVLSTLAFGDVAPNPIPSEGDLWTLGYSTDVPAGTVDLPLLGGVRLELVEDSFVFQGRPNFGAIPLEGQPADTEFLTAPFDADGNALGTVDDVVSAVSSGGADVTEIESTTMGGIEARVFEIEGGDLFTTVLKTVADEVDGWHAPPRGRMWVLEHPDRGVLVITGEAFENVDTTFPAIVARTEEIVASIEFIEVG